MEGHVTDGSHPAACEDNLKETDSVVNFQKFIYDLFEKNGILNDLRAYLRGHIIDVLKSSQTGEPPTCQKHFTQRLDLKYQALNMLIAEYLLRLEFSYSLSVFVSEIPLANMVFGFAKRLLQTDKENFEDLRFKENDVWSILNYLGIKCDSEHAFSILQQYNSKDNLPLLLCILKSMPMYQTLHRDSTPHIDHENCSSDSLSSSANSADMVNEVEAKSACKTDLDHEKCKHYVFCKSCQSRMKRLKEKYKLKQKHLIKDIKTCKTNSLNVETLMKNIGLMEKSLVDEMFQQLKGVYEAEVQMLKQDEEKSIKRSIATHALQLQKRRDEMEESFKAREKELERNVQEKKQFLWGLARALRDQHASMARAMHAVRDETDRLTAKEDSLKSQILEAEEILRKRGEEMRQQISNELAILEDHLQSMKIERENIHRERSELENLRAACNSSTAIKMQDLNNEELRSHYDLLRDELSILKKYLEATKLEPKCVIERSTLTELNNVTSKINLVLNNAHDCERVPLKSESDERSRTPNKVVNNLKKQKNVNFSTVYCKEGEFSRDSERSRSRSRSRSSASSEMGDVLERDMLQRLRDENERLKAFASQQREHIDDLSSHQARLQAELTAARFQAGTTRPRTAPTVMPSTPLLERLNLSASVNSVGWRKGAGEEISSFADARPRVLLPGDTLPFVGVLRDRHSDNRRYLSTLGGVLSRELCSVAKEKISSFADARPRVLLPGDTLPFVGVLRDRHSDNRRYLINQWRALRRRMSPIGGVGKVRNPVAVPRDRVPRDPRPAVPTGSVAPPVPISPPEAEICEKTPTLNETFTFQSDPRVRPKTAVVIEPPLTRDMSPKSVLREAKRKLRNKTNTKDPPKATRDKSPNAVLREAKLRLRKLEIEAEAVEKSYLDFRKRQTLLKKERSVMPGTSAPNDIFGTLGVKRSRSHTFEDNYRVETVPRFIHGEEHLKADFDKYLREYQTSFNASASHFKTISGNEKSKPIPAAYSKIDSGLKELQEKRDNYLETPLAEFRKLYQTPKSPPPTLPIDIPRRENRENLSDTEKLSTSIKVNSARESTESRSKSRGVESKLNELEILKENFGKMYNLQDNVEIAHKIESSLGKSESPRPKEELKEIIIEGAIEEASEASSIKIIPSSSPGDLLLVVESTVDTREIDVSDDEPEGQQISTQMTIIVSPKRSTPEGINESPAKSRKSSRSTSPEQVSKMSKNDVLDAIFHADSSKRQSSEEMHLNISKDLIEDSNSDYKGGEDYPDDFSADVDNYNSPSEYGNHSAISLPKNSEDETSGTDNFYKTPK